MKKTKLLVVAIVLVLGISLTTGCLGGEQENVEEENETEDNATENDSKPSISEKSIAKTRASDCAQALYKEGNEPGTPNETVCGDICSNVEGKDFPITQEAKENGVTTAYEACIAGKPTWIE